MTIEVSGFEVVVAALDDVIASEHWADRPKDHEALPELYELRRGLRDWRPGEDGNRRS